MLYQKCLHIVVQQSLVLFYLSLVFSYHSLVLASFPMCQMIQEDLTQNPRFSKLLAMLSQQVECHGLTLKLEKELEMVCTVS